MFTLLLLGFVSALQEPSLEPPPFEPNLAEDDLSAWVAHLRPSPDEVSWEAIPWLPSFLEGIRASAEQDKPLLFWAMNGHPLGCT